MECELVSPIPGSEPLSIVHYVLNRNVHGHNFDTTKAKKNIIFRRKFFEILIVTLLLTINIHPFDRNGEHRTNANDILFSFIVSVKPRPNRVLIPEIFSPRGVASKNPDCPVIYP